jgi:deoxyadenosine/deoxycytidine kinase
MAIRPSFIFIFLVGRGVILDRSVFSDWVFAEKNKIDKNITEEGFREYLEKRDMLLAHLPIPQITVYLDVSPSECYRRVHHLRGRVRKMRVRLREEEESWSRRAMSFTVLIKTQRIKN